MRTIKEALEDGSLSLEDEIDYADMTEEEYKNKIERLNKQIEEYQKALDETTSEKIDLENIIKEVREYVENNNLYEQDYTYDYEENIEEWPPDDTKARKELLEILDKLQELKGSNSNEQ